MRLSRYEPWSLLDQSSNGIHQIFNPFLTRDEKENASASDWVPDVDIKEEDDRFVIHADIPGVDPKDIEVHMENGMLSINGERSSETKDEREGYKRIERARGTFLRRFTLPDTADADKISAKSTNGVLEVVIPKHEKLQARKISVDS